MRKFTIQWEGVYKSHLGKSFCGGIEYIEAPSLTDAQLILRNKLSKEDIESRGYLVREILEAQTQRIVTDHKAKSDQVRVLKRKLKNSVPVGKLKELLAHEKRYEVSPYDHYSFISGLDDEGFARAEARLEARIELLEEIIEAWEVKK